MPAALPTFSRGLRLVRLAVFVMLLQLALTILVTVKTLYVDSPDSAKEALKWMRYLLLVNGGAAAAMGFAAARSIAELRRVSIAAGGLVTAAIGFAIATVMLLWTWHVLQNFVDVVFDPASTLDDMMAAADQLSSLKTVAIVKDLAYAVGLIALIRVVQRSAAHNDQLGLRDEAGSTSRALIVMLVADLFWQLTYGLGGSAGVMGLIGSLLVSVYWIYCHVRLARFLYNAAWFMNEPHELPVAMVVKMDKSGERPARSTAKGGAEVNDKSGERPARSTAKGGAEVNDKPVARPPVRPSQPALRPSAPPQPVAAAPKPVAPVVAPVAPSVAPPAAPPRPESPTSTTELDPNGPRFLR